MQGSQTLALYLLIAIAFVFWLHSTGKLPAIWALLTHDSFTGVASNGGTKNQTTVGGNNVVSADNSLGALQTAINTPSTASNNGGNSSGGGSVLNTLISAGPGIIGAIAAL